MGYSQKALARLTAERDDVISRARKLSEQVVAGTRSAGSSSEAEFASYQSEIDRLNQAVASAQRDVDDDAVNDQNSRDFQSSLSGKPFIHPARTESRLTQAGWSEQAATAIVEAQETRALNSGSIDLVSPLQLIAVKPQVPRRVLDLLVNVPAAADSNSTSYLRQTVRENNAATVADGAEKPVSVFTLTDEVDRLRTVAHVSQPIPLRFLSDRPQIQRFLEFEMSEGVLAAIENLVLTGDNVGENFAGLVPQAGTPVAFTGSAVQVTSNVLMAQLDIGERPTAWVLRSTDWETMTLERAGTSGVWLNGSPIDVAGRRLHGLPVVFGNITAGLAMLGDFSQADITSKDSSVMWDGGGALFTKNQCIVRGEVRCTLRVYRPSSFKVIDITA